MATFSTEASVLIQKADQLNRHAEEYDSIRAQLRQAATSMGAAYDSADNRAYTARIEQFCTDLQMMSDKLRAAARTLKEQSSMYTAQEEENTAAASKLP